MPANAPAEDRPGAGTAGAVFFGMLLLGTLVVVFVLFGRAEDHVAGPVAAGAATVAPSAAAEPAVEMAAEPPDAAAAAAPQPTPTPEPGPQGPPVTIAFGGDVMFEGMLRPQLDADPDGLLTEIAPVLGAADLAVVNLETAITEGGQAAPKQYAFRAPASGLQALRTAGVDAASLANNHGMDFGQEGLADSLDAATAAGLPLIGAGSDADAAYAPFLATVRGRRIAVLAATQVMDSAFLETWPATSQRPGLASAKPPHDERLLRAVREARAEADTVVVYLHWGVEAQHCPSERQQALARRLVDAGADIIAGGHAHRLQGAGMLDDALVAYGLGNFVFYADSGPAADTGVLTVTVEGREVLGYEWTPARLRAGVPHPLADEEAAGAREAWERLRECTGLAG